VGLWGGGGGGQKVVGDGAHGSEDWSVCTLTAPTPRAKVQVQFSHTLGRGWKGAPTAPLWAGGAGERTCAKRTPRFAAWESDAHKQSHAAEKKAIRARPPGVPSHAMPTSR
jgi:hypothetical protein